MNQRIFGLIGKTIKHSRSPEIFRNFFIKENITDAEYRLFPLEDISELKTILSSTQNLIGLNVTIPYKKAVIEFLDSFDETVEITGAVNTVKIFKTGKNILLKGYNTDYNAFLTQIQLLFPNRKINKALILGNGGASSTTVAVLKSMNAEVIVATRNPGGPYTVSYEEIDEAMLCETDIIVNATPLGMWPDVNTFPEIQYHFCKKETVFLDLVYNPEKTLFLKKAEEIGAKNANGLQILYMQAIAAWTIWNSKEDYI